MELVVLFFHKQGLVVISFFRGVCWQFYFSRAVALQSRAGSAPSYSIVPVSREPDLAPVSARIPGPVREGLDKREQLLVY